MNKKTKIYLFFILVFCFVSIQQVLASNLGFEYSNQLGLTNAEIQDPRTIAVNIVQFLLTFLGIVAVVIIMYGGFLWMTAAGSAERVEKAKKTLIAAAIGLVIIISAYVIVNLVIRATNVVINGACTAGDSEACGCGGTRACQADNTWGPCLGSNCGFSGTQGDFIIRNTIPHPNTINQPRNVDITAVFNKTIDASVNQATLNANFTVTQIEENIDPDTMVGTAVSAPIALEPIAISTNLRSLVAEAAADCGNELNTPNCLPAWGRYRVTIDSASGIVAVGGTQNLTCSNGLCQFEFTTNNLIDTNPPRAGIVPTQICRDDPAVPDDILFDSNTVGGWGQDDFSITRLEFYYYNGTATNSVNQVIPGTQVRYLYDDYQFDTTAYTLGSTYRFTVEAQDAAGDTDVDSFEAVVRVGHCCNGVLDGGEERADCGGPDCDSCDLQNPVITFVDPDNGAPGNWVTIGGRYFGTQEGEVYFSNGSGGWVGPAQFPDAANPSCSNNWSDRQIIAIVPAAAQTGAVRIVRADNREDTTDNAYGPPVGDFTVNATVRPGLCLAYPDFGFFENQFYLHGTGFSPLPHSALFGNENESMVAVTSNWLPSTTTVEVPNLAQGLTTVFVEAGGERSNYLNFTIQIDSTRRPVIDYIDPSTGPIGQYITIFGSNFDSFLNGTSRVEFDDGANRIEANGFSFPAECQNYWWNNTFIIVKVPQGINLGTSNVRVTNRSGITSDTEPFTVIAGDPSPGICLLSPHNGLVGSSLDIYGDNLNDAGNAEIVRFYNNIVVNTAAASSWANQNIDLAVPVGAETGPVRVVNSSGAVSNSLNFMVGPCNVATDCYPTEECCGAASTWAGVCRPSGQCGAGSIGVTGWGWSFMTGAGADSLTCGGYSSQAACGDAGNCPNSPGTCQTTTDLETGLLCSDVDCQNRFPLSCPGGSCSFDDALNRCISNTDICTPTLIGWTDASCNQVGGQAIWQVRQPSSCPLGSYRDTNNWCTIGSIGNPTTCEVCAAGLVCQNNGSCAVPNRICPENSDCVAGQCVLDNDICECCCDVTQSAQDCCQGLTCIPGGCGDPTDLSPADGINDYGICGGCRVNVAGVFNQVASDEACNCDGTQGKYCEVLNPFDPNDTGVCRDAMTCDTDIYAAGCQAGGTCPTGQFCGNDCFCYAALPCDGDSNIGNGCSAVGNCGTDMACDYSDCLCKPGIACDTDPSDGFCSPDNAACPPDYTCGIDCFCDPIPVPPGDPCDTNPAPGPANVTCDQNHCGQGYECSTYDPVNSPCGSCCCDMANANTPADSCLLINTNLFCAQSQDVYNNCYDTDPVVAPNFGVCCGCSADTECGDPLNQGCGSDTCCRARPYVESTLPIDDPSDADAGDVCRNTLIEATFNTTMDLSSFTGKLIVFGDYGADQCPANTTFLADARPDLSRFARLYYKVLQTIGRIAQPIMPQRFAQAFTVPSSARNYCAIRGSVSGHHIAGNRSVITFRPSALLDRNRLYYAAILGDENLDSSAGVRDAFDVGMYGSAMSPSGGTNNTYNSITYTNAYIWSFRTMSDLELCEINRVQLEPISYLFQTNVNDANESDIDMNADSFDRTSDADKLFVANALDRQGRKIVSIPGVYEFNWTWSIVDPSIVDFAPVANLPENQRLVRADADITDGKTIINATAASQAMAAAYPPFSITGSSNAYVFLCKNPWPPIDEFGNWRPWRDDVQGLLNCVGGDGTCPNTNYEIYYCRDAGNPGTFDDLPPINSSSVVNRDESPLACSLPGGSCVGLQDGAACGPNNAGVCNRVLKESFFFRENTPNISLITLNGTANADGTVSLHWNDIPAAFIPAGEVIDGYKIYYGEQAGSRANEIEVSLIDNHSAAMPFVVESLRAGTTYYFAITALYVSTAESGFSNEVSLTPVDTTALPTPVILSVNPRDSEVELAWTDVPEAASYRIYYGVNPGVYGSSQNIGADTRIIISGLTNGRTYYFSVTSVDQNDNESAKSSAVAATPDALAVGLLGSGEVVLTWNTAGSVGNYNIYYVEID